MLKNPKRPDCLGSEVFFFFFFFSQLCWVFPYCSSAERMVTHQLCGAWVDCGGFSCCRAQAVGAQASVVKAHGLSSCGWWTLELRLELWHTGLVALWQTESSWTRDQSCVSCIGRQILIHCTTREVLGVVFIDKIWGESCRVCDCLLIGW